jgi:hypothetical protein
MDIDQISSDTECVLLSTENIGFNMKQIKTLTLVCMFANNKEASKN